MGKKQPGGYITRPMHRRNGDAAAFSLIEVLIATSVIAVLSSLTVVAVTKVRTHAEATRGVTAAKALINAFLLYGAENNNQTFIGYDQRAGREYSVWYREREITNAEAPHRYPFRLAEYLNDELHGSIFAGKNSEQMLEIQGGINDYNTSLYPAFGMNYNFVGGFMQTNGTFTGPTKQDAVLSHYDENSELIVFASSGIKFGTQKVDGFHEIKPPNFYGNQWSTSRWRDNSNPSVYGNVDARFDNQAVVAMMDGSVHLMTMDELRDMRLWSREAKVQNDRYYQPSYTPVFER